MQTLSQKLADVSITCPVCKKFYSFCDVRVTKTVEGKRIDKCLSCWITPTMHTIPISKITPRLL